MSDKEKFEKLAKKSQKFCDWAEGEPADTDTEARLGLKAMSLLYAAALSLAGLDLPDEEQHDLEKRIPVDQWRNVYDRFESLPVSTYAEANHPLERRTELIYTDLQEELADIYQDVAEGLALYKDGLVSDALWHWRLTFEFHWGRRLLSVMNVLHSYFEERSDWEIFSQNK
jgi:hypothetical protein